MTYSNIRMNRFNHIYSGFSRRANEFSFRLLICFFVCGSMSGLRRKAINMLSKTRPLSSRIQSAHHFGHDFVRAKPRGIVRVFPATYPITTAVAALAMPTML